MNKLTYLACAACIACTSFSARIVSAQAPIEPETGKPASDAAAETSTTTAIIVPAAAVTASPSLQESPTLNVLPFPIHFSGFVDTYVMFNFNNPSDDADPVTCPAPCVGADLRGFDVRSHEFALAVAELAVWVDPAPIGARLDFNFGPTADLFHATEPGSIEIFKHIQQAYGTALFNVGRGLTLDVGKFSTPYGQEVIEARDDWNYSRSFLFNYAGPFYHLGLRLGYSFTDNFSASILLVNGWDNVFDNNDGKTGGIQFTIKPCDKLSLVVGYLIGPEQSNQDTNLRHYVDAIATWSLDEHFSLAFNGDFGTEKNAVAAGDAFWYGGALSARLAYGWFAAAVRGEIFRDEQGFRTKVVQTLYEGTATLECRWHNNMITRLEYRHDQSNAAPFRTDGVATKNHQDTLTVGMIFGF